MALLIAIHMSPQRYNVRSRGVRIVNTLDLNRHERTSRNAHERQISIAAGQNTNVTSAAHIQHAARVDVGVDDIALARSSENIRAQAQLGRAVDSRNQSSRRVGRVVHDVALKVAGESSSAVHQLVRRSAVRSAADARTTSVGDVDAVGRDDGYARADLKFLICYYLPNGN